ncbi:MAG: hypothetical protein KKG59_01560 [Nanoarchaeota archaeon]|nr:hypothetical protein [Nanoarchaeota archaeon]
MIVETFSGTRGLYNDSFRELAGSYAKAYADFLKQENETPTIVLGYDTRPSSEAVFIRMCKVLNYEGVKVIGLGVMPTPAIEHAVRELGIDGGIIITGSHNEPEHNGWKLLQNNGAILTTEQIGPIIEEARKVKSVEGDLAFDDKHEEIVDSYCDFVKDMVKDVDFKGKFVIDPNGGAGIVVLKKLLEQFKVPGVIVNGKIGEFNRLVEPNKQSLATLKPVLKEHKAEFGFGFDCDADRVEIVLDTGEVVDGNYVLAMTADLILEEEKGSVVTNDATSNVVKFVCDKHGVNLIEVEVGETNVVEKMAELKSPVGGEGSNGGVIVPPNKCRDGILTVFQILKFLGKRKLVDVVKEYPVYHEERAKIKCNPSKVSETNKFLEDQFSKKGYVIQRRGDDLGTVKLVFDDGWLFFRASRTEPGAFRIIANGLDEKKVREWLNMGVEAFTLKSSRRSPL